jgi:hypothetical protein|tara:strand:+ start:442 stop:651 length:210 start_codon:yes stop_codon:yes gene_type:complete
MEGLDRKNEIQIIEIRGELKLLVQQLQTLKNNDLYHLQKSVEGIQKVLWAVGFLVLGQLGIAIRAALWG